MFSSSEWWGQVEFRQNREKKGASLNNLSKKHRTIDKRSEIIRSPAILQSPDIQILSLFLFFLTLRGRKLPLFMKGTAGLVESLPAFHRLGRVAVYTHCGDTWERESSEMEANISLWSTLSGRSLTLEEVTYAWKRTSLYSFWESVYVSLEVNSLISKIGKPRLMRS